VSRIASLPSRARRFLVIAWLLASALAALLFSIPFEESEFSGASVTGPVLSVYGLSTGLLVVAAACCGLRRRTTAAAISVVAVVLAVPLYVYLFLPGLFR